LQVNKPVDEYLAKGLPSYIQGVSAEHIPGWLGGGKGKTFRVQSLFPASVPSDIALAALQGSPLEAAGYANPLPVSAYNVAQRSYQTASGETKRTSYGGALEKAAERLTPGVTFLRDEAQPKGGENRIYPDTSRLGRLAREAGVVPVKINQAAALRARFNERGMTKSVQVVDDRRDLYERITAAGEKPSPVLDQAYKVRLERANRLDGIRAHGLPYQQRAYASDIAYLVKLKRITPAEAKATLAAAKGADEATLKKWRGWLTEHKFGGDVIGDVKRYLDKQPVTAPAAAATG
jgi:hypothetical protein